MGTYLARPCIRKDREDLEGPSGMRIACAAMQGWRVSQEDAYLALPDFDKELGLSLFGVFDGHCGGVVSRMVADLLPQKIKLAPAYRTGDYPKALHQAFLDVDKRLDCPVGRRQVSEEAAKVRASFVDSLKMDAEIEAEGLSVVEMLDELCADNPDGMGCTANVALIEHHNQDLSQPPMRLHVANCGDSRCVIWDDEGKITPMSKDHKPQHAEELARIRAAGGWISPDGRVEDNLNLSRALGDFAYKRTRKTQPPERQMISGVPDIRTRLLRPIDRYILIGCDGIWELNRRSQATVDAVQALLPPPGSGGRLSKALAQFMDANLASDQQNDRGEQSTGLGMDNMTALLLELPDDRSAEEKAEANVQDRILIKKPAARIPRKTNKRKSGTRPSGTRPSGTRQSGTRQSGSREIVGKRPAAKRQSGRHPRKTIAKRPSGRSARPSTDID